MRRNMITRMGITNRVIQAPSKNLLNPMINTVAPVVKAPNPFSSALNNQPALRLRHQCNTIPACEKVNARIKIPRTAIETIISIKRKPLYFTFVADNFNSPKSRQGVIAPDKLLIIEIPGEKIARTTKPTTIPMQRMIHGQMMNLARLTL